MNKKVLIIWLLLSASAAKSYDLKEYCGYKVYDSIEVYNKDFKYNARMYIFTDYNACIVCNSNIQYYEEIFRGSNVEIIVFISGIGDEEVRYLKKNNEIKSIVISDKLDLYRQFYRVNKLPFFMFTDNYGQILAMDKLGGTNYRGKEIENILDSLIKNKPFENESYLKEIFRYDIVQSGVPLICGRKRNVLWSEKQNKCYIQTENNSTIYEVDSSGIVIKLHKPCKAIKFYCDYSTSPSWVVEDSIIMGISSDDDGYFSYFYDLIKDTIYYVFRFDKLEDEFLSNNGFILGIDFKYAAFNNSIISSYYDMSKNTLLIDSMKTLIRIDSSLKSYIIFGTPDSIYNKRALSCLFQEFFTHTKEGLIISIQMFSNIIKQYNNQGKLLKKYTIDFGSGWRKINEDFRYDLYSDAGYWAGFRNRNSFYQEIFYSSIPEYIVILYENRIYPEGVTDRYSRLIKRNFYINLSDLNGKALLKDDLMLPLECLPFYFKGKGFWATELKDNKLQLVKYELKENILK